MRVLVQSLGSGRATDGYDRLLAQVRAELPAGQPLPVACEAALAPVSVEELSICETMRCEYSSSAAAIDAIDDPKLAGTMQAALNRLVYDPEKTRALIAGNFAPACSSATRAMLAADGPPGWPQDPHPRFRMESIATLAGRIPPHYPTPAAPAYRSPAPTSA